MHRHLQQLLDRNREWAAGATASDPQFFTRLLAQQKPQYMWIGCADSRVPANQILGLLPGEVFVHRNIANVVVHSDLNALSVIQYAVDQLQVQHVIVVGHYGCGGVTAALTDTRIGVADNWLRHVQDVRNGHREWLAGLAGEAERVSALCELNVLEQARNVCQTTVLQDAWARGQEVVVHGLVYGLHDGLLHDLQVDAAGPRDVDPAYARALAAIMRRYLGATP